VFPFRGSITIDTNRKSAPDSAAKPGSNPICQKRIIDSIATDFTPTQDGQMVLRVDPRAWLAGVSFASLPVVQGVSTIADAADNPASIQVFNNARKNVSVYRMEFVP
jgi:hypothetical protein